MDYIRFNFPGIPGVKCAFGMRLNLTDRSVDECGNISPTSGSDVSAVLENRRKVRADLGFQSWQELNQVHGDRVIFDPQGDLLETGGKEDADGLATTQPGQALVIKSADCQPILLAHRDGKHIAALHVGWRGNALNFPASGLKQFCAYYNLSPGDLMAVRGPSLSPQNAEFTNFDQDFGPGFEDFYSPATHLVNLWAMTRMQLWSTGIPRENVFSLDICTSASPYFFSYREDATPGRQGSYIWIEGNEESQQDIIYSQ